LPLPAAVSPSVISYEGTEPYAMVYLSYLGAALLAVGPLVPGIGLVQSSRQGRGGGRRRAA
jgi:hypothetical protein